MHKYDEVAPAAFCASFIAYIFKTGLADTFEDLINEENGPIPPRIASFINSLERFHFEEDPSITIERLFYQKLDRYETLQNHLNYILENERKEARKLMIYLDYNGLLLCKILMLGGFSVWSRNSRIIIWKMRNTGLLYSGVLII